jgi:mycofactocin precursor peptide peptidase
VTTLGDLTWPEVERLAADGAVLAVPVGSVVQHGPHLPLSTDTDIAVGNTAPLAELMDTLHSAGVRAVSPSGVLGDPSGASGDEGEQLLRSLSSELLAVVSRWMLQPPVSRGW